MEDTEDCLVGLRRICSCGAQSCDECWCKTVFI